MRVITLITVMVLCSVPSYASEVRDFDLGTLQRLGNELTRVGQRADKGASDSVRKRALQTATGALKGKLFDSHYDYFILDDPDGSGFLVYALAGTRNANEVVLAGHIRVTVSANGQNVERIDRLSKALATSGPLDDAVVLWLVQLISNKPVETLIYTSNLVKKPVVVRTPDGKTWLVENGKMSIYQKR